MVDPAPCLVVSERHGRFKVERMSSLLARIAGSLAVAMTTALLAACAAPSGAPSRASAPAALLTPTPVSAVAPLRIPSLRELTGLRPPEIIAMLGQPELKRDESPAQLWQYRTADCVLNLFFYRDPSGYRLMRAESWARDFAASATPTRCRDANAPAAAHLAATRSAL
jgi:hypothetical protein